MSIMVIKNYMKDGCLVMNYTKDKYFSPQKLQWEMLRKYLITKNIF